MKMSLIKSLLADLTAKRKADTPNPYKLADAEDEAGWDRRTNGLMADAGTADDVVPTEPYKEDA
jgi:hypothetical protein